MLLNHEIYCAVYDNAQVILHAASLQKFSAEARNLNILAESAYKP